ncbi:hypothetical protein [Pseudomonas sp. RIT-PI-AD]|uniref:PA0061/PA0062 family lipoprotein n=1 Tax=Pseudomonas sp. RIT-PI-AD TaxID=3035294 RepID=UPI0021DAD9AD|nr:hypothetical protein [Pseudomonas sp. RIT-PI-AD]
MSRASIHRVFPLIALGLSACASSTLPTPDPQQAWIDVYATPGQTVSATRQDGQPAGDARYFQVAPGAHELQVRYQYEVNSASRDGVSESMQITCQLRVSYEGFVAGQRYRLEVRPLVLKAQGYLFDAQRRLLARAEVLRCGPI